MGGNVGASNSVEFDLGGGAEHPEGFISVEIFGDDLAIDQVAMRDGRGSQEAVRGADVFHGCVVANGVDDGLRFV